MRREMAPHQADPAYPVDDPLATSKALALTSINSQIGSGNDGAHTGTTPSRRTGKRRIQLRDVEALEDRLSQRDLSVLQSVAEHQFLTVRQVEALHFADHAPASGARITRRTLARLRRLRLLNTLDRRIGGLGAGSQGLVHYIDVVGDQLLRRRSGRRARRFHEPSRRFVRHRLAIVNTRLALIQADWQGEFELVDSAVEPASWRRYTGIGGARLTLKTDLYAETAVTRGSEFVHAWFIEVDLGTEHIPTLLRKCRDYEAYRRTGTEQADGGSFPLVIWSVTHLDPAKAELRRLALREAIDSDRTLPDALFRITAPDQLVPILAGGGQK
jgi:hypothetical protein